VTRARSRLALVAVVVGLVGAAATARAAPVPLPSVLVQVTLVPPFPTPTTGGENEGGVLRFPTRSVQHVTVGVDPTGRPISVRVRSQLVLRRTGDYSFVIGAPVEDVRAAPGSESEPGLRSGAILWAGFSPGRKVLAADVVLRPGAAARALPLRVEVTRAAGGVRVRLRNTTRALVSAISGSATPLEAARALDAVRRRGANPSAQPVNVNFAGSPAAEKTVIAAPLRVRGQLVFPAGTLAGKTIEGGVPDGDEIDVDAVLGDDTPLVHDVVVLGIEVVPKLGLLATPQSPVQMLAPPAGDSWRAFVRGRKVRGRDLIARAVAARLAFARARQYQTFLSDPDPIGPRSATYRFVTAAPPTRATSQPGPGGGGSAWLPFVLVPLGVAVLAGLVVLWAHS